jgi:hypothetical protein
MIKVLKEGMHAMKMATATSTQDQFMALTIDPKHSNIIHQSGLIRQD